jgi:hypothetical protein
MQPAPLHQPLTQLLSQLCGVSAAQQLLHTLQVPASLMQPTSHGHVQRAHIAQAMNMALFADLLQRVPSGAAYVHEKTQAGHTVCFDHGALRTVAWPHNGTLPSGRAAITRVLEPLGYSQAAIYPLERLKMTGYAYRHQDLPEDIAQYFVSELHPERFSQAFQTAVSEVSSHSTDPLDAAATALLATLVREGGLPITAAAELAAACLRCFGRQHPEPSLQAYDTLKAESAEMAWIATEGNAFNHATDRVADVFATADEQRRAGRAIKDKVEVSTTGRVRQTALLADKVTRGFIDTTGQRLELSVPGSFYEFISRDPLPGSTALDLAFDTGNATGIFKVTAGA